MDLLSSQVLGQRRRYQNLIASAKWVAPSATELPLAATANGDGVADDFLQGFGAETEAPDPPPKKSSPQPDSDKKDEKKSHQEKTIISSASLRTERTETVDLHAANRAIATWQRPAFRALPLSATGLSGAAQSLKGN